MSAWTARGIFYVSKGSSVVRIPQRINPFQVFGLKGVEELQHDVLKVNFGKLIGDENRNHRALVSLSYAILCDIFFKNNSSYFRATSDPKLFEFNALNPVVMALTGQCEALEQQSRKSPSILKACEPLGYSLLYIASRSGYIDLVTFLIQAGADVNRVECVKGNRTSSLHAASFYGHYPVVSALVARGASVKTKNLYNATPEEEARKTEIKELLKESLSNPLLIFIQKVHKVPFMNKMEKIVKDEKVIAYRIERNVSERRVYVREWQRAWHGTKKAHIMSILKNGLRKPGEVVDGVCVQEADNHIGAGVKVDGIPNWSSAVFVSPQVDYASNPCYAERIVTPGKGEYCLLLDVAVRPGSYTEHPSTTVGYTTRSGKEEVRVEAGGKESTEERSDDAQIIRIGVSANVVVLNLILLSVNFVENAGMEEEEVSELIRGGDK